MISENGDRPNLQTGGMVISRTLRRFGINTTFALAGASHTFLLDALDRDDFKIILGRHETGTVGAADGFARVTRKVGVALIVSDQGIPNAITGILTAYEACSPVIVICVRRITTSIENQTLLDHEKLELVRPITKSLRPNIFATLVEPLTNNSAPTNNIASPTQNRKVGLRILHF